ncbi:hypothetical protein Cgig2_007175 [Carnegiea gigantea]|uniref:Pentatricopeptide repeat-containing protein n=1 Tax=Carnegiea gigantea TaxID=171969 RepID=A0A9Q1JII5_9CARY|nr:hypothetical protein Cgig2_007175 [Carnegiea gigantea]
MLEKGVNENMDLAAKILEALLLRGHVEEALGRIELLMHTGYALDVDRLLSVLSDKEKTIAALKLLDFALERDFTLDFSSYDKFLEALLAAGKTLDAYSILCKISQKRGVTDKNSCESLIKTLNEEGNTKQADILSRMVQGASKGHSTKKGKRQDFIHSGLLKKRFDVTGDGDVQERCKSQTGTRPSKHHDMTAEAVNVFTVHILAEERAAEQISLPTKSTFYMVSEPIPKDKISSSANLDFNGRR